MYSNFTHIMNQSRMKYEEDIANLHGLRLNDTTHLRRIVKKHLNGSMHFFSNCNIVGLQNLL